MGSGIAHVASLSQYSVLLMDVNEQLVEKGINSINNNMDRQIKKTSITPDDKKNALDRISLTTDLNALKSVDVIIEAASEDRKIKGRIFQELDKSCKKDTILATNTSSISITDIASSTSRPEKVIGMHFMNPVPMMKLVEVVLGHLTNEETIRKVVTLAEAMGKTAIIVRDVPGFATSRLGVVLGNEAIRMLAEGVASASDIDTAMRLGYRHPMGPLELSDLVGLDVRRDILNSLATAFDDESYRPHPLLRELVDSGDLGKKTGRGIYDWTSGEKVERE